MGGSSKRQSPLCHIDAGSGLRAWGSRFRVQAHCCDALACSRARLDLSGSRLTAPAASSVAAARPQGLPCRVNLTLAAALGVPWAGCTASGPLAGPGTCCWSCVAAAEAGLLPTGAPACSHGCAKGLSPSMRPKLACPLSGCAACSPCCACCAASCAGCCSTTGAVPELGPSGDAWVPAAPPACRCRAHLRCSRWSCCGVSCDNSSLLASSFCSTQDMCEHAEA